MMAIIATILRFLGFVEEAVQLEQYLAAKAKAKDVANSPETKDEWTKSADRGDL